MLIWFCNSPPYGSAWQGGLSSCRPETEAPPHRSGWRGRDFGCKVTPTSRPAPSLGRYISVKISTGTQKGRPPSPRRCFPGGLGGLPVSRPCRFRGHFVKSLQTSPRLGGATDEVWPVPYSASGAWSMRSRNWSSFGVMMICVRRLRARPSALALLSRGLYSPRPPAVRRLGFTP